jgi:Ca2+-binding RTX toxin-like protein
MTFTLSDGFVSADAVLTLDVVLENQAPTFTSAPVRSALAGHAYTYQLTATDADGEPLHFTGETLPAWLTLVDHGDGTATLSGTPGAAATAGDVNITVTDGYVSPSQTFTINVAPNRAPAFTNTPPAPVVAGTPFVYTITTADLDGDFRAISASVLPAWLTLIDNGNGTATLSGVPNDIDGGVNPVVLRASDGISTTEQAFNIEVLVERFRLINGVLQVTGGIDADTIDVWIRNGDQVRAVRNGVIKNYPLSAIKEVQLLGFDGNDSISVNSRSIPAYAVGGAGNDTILGGDEPDNFVGGGGKDILDSGGGNDRLDGSGGNDKLLGGAGDDRLIGNDGNDVLIGGDGTDQFLGGNGDDVLYSRDLFADILNGGDGTDSAQLDALDLKDDPLTLLP